MRTAVLSLGVILAVVIAGLVWWQRPDPTRNAPLEPPAVANASPVEPTPPELARPAESIRETIDVQGPEESKPLSSAPIPAPSGPATPDLAKLSETELEAEADRLEDELSKVSTPILQSMIDAGLGEVLDTPNSYKFRDGDNETILLVQFPPGGAGVRVALSREDYPDLYVTKGRILELRRVAREKEHERALARMRAAQPDTKD